MTIHADLVKVEEHFFDWNLLTLFVFVPVRDLNKSPPYKCIRIERITKKYSSFTRKKNKSEGRATDKLVWYRESSSKRWPKREQGKGKTGSLHVLYNISTTFASSALDSAYSGSRRATPAARNLPTDSRADCDRACPAHRGAPVPRPGACPGRAGGRTTLAAATLSRRP